MKNVERIEGIIRLTLAMASLSVNPSEDSCPTRPSLLQRLQQGGDAPSWQEFQDLYGGLISRFARKAGLTKAEAEEVVQETIISAATNLPKFHYDPAVCSFKTWLLNLTRWRITDQRRKRLPRAAPSGSTEGPTTGTATIDRVPDPATSELDQLWEAEWHRTLLDRAVQVVKTQVDLKQWQVFDLYVLKEWSAREVAKALEVSLPAVYLAKHRVGGLIRKELERLRKEAEAEG
jgi:RNA polymerase sigma factor (sigma-70 family)